MQTIKSFLSDAFAVLTFATAFGVIALMGAAIVNGNAGLLGAGFLTVFIIPVLGFISNALD